MTHRSFSATSTANGLPDQVKGREIMLAGMLSGGTLVVALIASGTVELAFDVLAWSDMVGSCH